MLGVSLALPVHPSLRLAAVVSRRVVMHHVGIRQHRRDEVEVCGFHLAQAQTIRFDDPCRGVWHSRSYASNYRTSSCHASATWHAKPAAKLRVRIHGSANVYAKRCTTRAQK